VSKNLSAHGSIPFTNGHDPLRQTLKQIKQKK